MYMPYDDFVPRGSEAVELLENLNKSANKAFGAYITTVEKYEHPVDFSTLSFSIDIKEHGCDHLLVSYTLKDKYDWTQPFSQN